MSRSSDMTKIITSKDVQVFLNSRGIKIDEIAPYANGMASRNYRATNNAGVDLTVRCDLRRPLEKVVEDRIFAAYAQQQGIIVPVGPWIDGYLGTYATTVRPTIRGKSLAETSREELPSPALIGEMLARLHKARLPDIVRPFFYEAMFEANPSYTSAIEVAQHHFDADPSIGILVRFAKQQLDRDRESFLAAARLPLSIIHGDFNAPNMILSSGKLTLIDWEKACVGYAIADFVQGLYYFSASYRQKGSSFAAAYCEAYYRHRQFPRAVLDKWITYFPAFIFLRDTISATMPRFGDVGRLQTERFMDYVQHDSGPRFYHFLEHSEEMRRSTFA